MMKIYNKTGDDELQMIHIVLSIHDESGEYSRHAGVTIASIFSNTILKVIIHLFHDETLTEENKNSFMLISNYFHQEIEFHKIVINDQPAKLKKKLMVHSIGKLFRLVIAEKLVHVDKVIYLDTDVIVNMDIGELWNKNIEQYEIAAVLDSAYTRNRYCKGLPLNPKKYFNSGVVYFNLKKIREKHNMFSEGIDFICKYQNTSHLDQPALNYLFQENCLFLDESYNTIIDFKSGKINEEKKFYHFAGAYKPWETRTSKIGDLYWKYLIMTPWGNSFEKLSNNYMKLKDTLDTSILCYPIGKKRLFIKNLAARIYLEIKKELRIRL